MPPNNNDANTLPQNTTKVTCKVSYILGQCNLLNSILIARAVFKNFFPQRVAEKTKKEQYKTVVIVINCNNCLILGKMYPQNIIGRINKTIKNRLIYLNVYLC